MQGPTPPGFFSSPFPMFTSRSERPAAAAQAVPSICNRNCCRFVHLRLGMDGANTLDNHFGFHRLLGSWQGFGSAPCMRVRTALPRHSGPFFSRFGRFGGCLRHNAVPDSSQGSLLVQASLVVCASDFRDNQRGKVAQHCRISSLAVAGQPPRLT